MAGIGGGLLHGVSDRYFVVGMAMVGVVANGGDWQRDYFVMGCGADDGACVRRGEVQGRAAMIETVARGWPRD